MISRSSVLLLGMLLPAIAAVPVAVAQPAPPTVTDERPLKQGTFPNWMDSVSFPNDQRNMQGPQEPVDPDPRSPVRAPAGPGEKSRFRFNPPKMPDLSAIRKKAWKSQYQRIGSSSETIQHEQFTSQNLEAEKKRQYELGLLYDAFPPGQQREEIAAMLSQQRNRVSAAEELLRLILPANDAASVVVDLGTRALPQAQSASGADSKVLDLGFGVGSDTAPASSPAVVPTRAVSPPTPTAPAKPVRDARTERRIRDLLLILYPPGDPAAQPTIPAEMPQARLTEPAGLEPSQPATSATSAPSEHPSPSPATGRIGNASAVPDQELTAPEPAHIPERFYRPTPTPSLYRDNRENASGE